MSELSKAEMYRRYKQQEDWAKEILAHAQHIAEIDRYRGEEIRILIENALIAAGEARRLRRDIRQYYNGDDPGHEEAIAWVHTNIIEPARQLGDSLGLQYNPSSTDHCRPTTSSYYRRIRRNVDGLFPADQCEPARACFRNPQNTNHAFFIANVGCVEIDVRPGHTDDTIAHGPKLAINQWSCLQTVGFFSIDAVLPLPGKPYMAYFFSGDRYALVDIYNNQVEGPKIINREWPSLRQAGFDLIDAVLPNPKNSDEAYFFSGKQYALIKIRPGTNDDSIVNGPKNIIAEWPSLRIAGFETVEAILPHPTSQTSAYFFSGRNYALIDIKPGSNDDTIINGPKLIATNWPSLREALFY